jgi:hypothetical protein
MKDELHDFGRLFVQFGLASPRNDVALGTDFERSAFGLVRHAKEGSRLGPRHIPDSVLSPRNCERASTTLCMGIRKPLLSRRSKKAEVEMPVLTTLGQTGVENYS